MDDVRRRKRRRELHGRDAGGPPGPGAASGAAASSRAPPRGGAGRRFPGQSAPARKAGSERGGRNFPGPAGCRKPGRTRSRSCAAKAGPGPRRKGRGAPGAPRTGREVPERTGGAVCRRWAPSPPRTAPGHFKKPGLPERRCRCGRKSAPSGAAAVQTIFRPRPLPRQIRGIRHQGPGAGRSLRQTCPARRYRGICQVPETRPSRHPRSSVPRGRPGGECRKPAGPGPRALRGGVRARGSPAAAPAKPDRPEMAGPSLPVPRVENGERRPHRPTPADEAGRPCQGTREHVCRDSPGTGSDSGPVPGPAGFPSANRNAAAFRGLPGRILMPGRRKTPPPYIM
jgi:hypothetical protein